MNVNGDVCCICFEELEKYKYIKLFCKHVFHSECFVKYINHQFMNHDTFCTLKCPLCKEVMFSITHINIDVEREELYKQTIQRKTRHIICFLFLSTFLFFCTICVSSLYLYSTQSHLEDSDNNSFNKTII